MSWSQTATFTGTWSFPVLPAAAADGNGNLLITWADEATNLNLLYTKTTGGEGNPIVLPYGAQGSPSCVYAGGFFYVFWRTAGTGQLSYARYTYGGSTSQGIGSGVPLNGAFSADGPQITLVEGTQGQPFPEPCIYIVWRGTGADEQLYSGYLSNLTGTPNWSGVIPFASNASMQSPFSPTAGTNQSEFMYAVWRGTTVDRTLYFASSLNFTSQNPYAPLTPITANGTTLLTDGRPSLQVVPAGGNSGSIVLVYSLNGALQYTTGIYNTLTVSGWTSQETISTPDFPTPAGVLVNQPSQAGPVQMIAGNCSPNGEITNVLYLYNYLPD